MDAYSAINEFFESKDADSVEMAKALLPLRFNENVSKEIEQIRTKVGILDLKALNLISMEGPEACDFLQGMVSNDIKLIEVGQLQANLISHHRGKILYHIDVFRQSKDRYIICTDAGEGNSVGGYLDHFHITEELELKLLNPNLIRCDLIGPHTEKTLKKVGYKGDSQWKFNSHEMISIANPLGALSRFVSIVPIAGYLEFIQFLLENSEAALVGFEAFEEIRVFEKVPRAGIDYTQNNFPQEAGLANHISYEKGCYIGQEPHARMYHRGHPNWQSVAISMPVSLNLKIDQKLFQEDEEIGSITSLSSIEEDGERRGIAFIKYDVVKEKLPLAHEANEQAVIQQMPLSTAQ